MNRTRTDESENSDAQEAMPPVRRIRKADREGRVGRLVDPVPSLQRQRREVARTPDVPMAPAGEPGPSQSIRTDRLDTDMAKLAQRPALTLVPPLPDSFPFAGVAGILERAGRPLSVLADFLPPETFGELAAYMALRGSAATAEASRP